MPVCVLFPHLHPQALRAPPLKSPEISEFLDDDNTLSVSFIVVGLGFLKNVPIVMERRRDSTFAQPTFSPLKPSHYFNTFDYSLGKYRRQAIKPVYANP